MNSTSHRFKLYILAAFCVAIVASTATSRGATVFRETFNRANDTNFGNNSGPEGIGPWSETLTIAGAGTQGTLEVNSNMAVATHNAGDGIYQLSTSTSNFATPYPVSAKFGDAPGKITWNINMQSSLTTPNGIGVNAGGMGFALGATNTNLGQTGNNGYILYIGNTGTPDPIHLAAFTSSTGFPTGLVDIVLGTSAPFNDVGASTDYFSFRVEFEPSTSTWELFARNDGASGFTDPEINAGYTSLGTGVNSTYTSTALPIMGLTGSWRNPSLVSRYDNITVGVVPEPSSLALVGLGAAALVACVRRRNRK